MRQAGDEVRLLSGAAPRQLEISCGQCNVGAGPKVPKHGAGLKVPGRGSEWDSLRSVAVGCGT